MQAPAPTLRERLRALRAAGLSGVAERARDVRENFRALWQASMKDTLSLASMREAAVAFPREGFAPSLLYRLHAASIGDKVALIDGDRSVTFRQLHQRGNRLANALLGLGLASGDRIVLMMKNRLEHFETAAASAKLRGSLVPVPWRATAQEVGYIASDAEARAIVFAAEQADVAMTVAETHRIPVRICASYGAEPPAPAGARSYEEVLSAGSDTNPPPPRDLASQVYIYTSGTTGRPKGAVRSFTRGSLRELCHLLRVLPMRHTDVHAVACPLYHSTGMGFAAIHFALGSTLVVLPRFDADGFLEAASRHRVTTTALVPVMIDDLLEAHARRSDRPLASMRILLSAAATLPEKTAARVLSEIGPVIYNLYGATELGWVTVATPRDLGDAPGTIGRAVPGCDIRILDGERREVTAGEVGELFVRTELIMDGYHKNPSATEAMRHGEWSSVGDLARRDAQGRISLVGRKVDMVISGGVNIYPAEIEAALSLCPGVLESAVVGIPDERWGESLFAFVVARPGAAPAPEELERFLRGQLTGYKVPRRYAFLESLPRNPTGKVLKRLLRDDAISRARGWHSL